MALSSCSVAIFQAHKAYLLRSACAQPFEVVSFPEIEESLKSILWNLNRVNAAGYSLAFEGVQWALFMVALEVRSPDNE